MSMIPPNLPPHVADRLGRAQMDDDCRRTVAMAEAFGERIAVKRLQLGDWRAGGFGEWRTIYITGGESSAGKIR